MTRQTSPKPSREGEGDPWAAFGYVVAGVGLYGFLGWLAGHFLHASYLLPIGLLVGAAFGTYMIFARYRFRGDDDAKMTIKAPIDTARPFLRDERDDRGEPQ